MGVQDIKGGFAMKGKSILLYFILLLMSIAGFYGLLIMISMIHSGDIAPKGAGAAVSNAIGFLINYLD